MNARASLYGPLACALASLVRRRAAPAGRECLADLAARLSLAQAQGHVCLDLAALADDDIPSLSGAPWLPPEALAAQIAGDDWVSADGAAPYVLDGGRFYAQEYFYRETRTARRLLDMAAQPIAQNANMAALSRVFGEGGDAGQLAAARAVLEKRFVMIAGGPGTGKTYTLARALALLLAQGLTPSQVALCAPTGRGAVRLGESLRAQLDEVSAQLGAPPLAQPLTPLTLHRLLGLRRQSDRPQYHAKKPLPHTLVVVDESSMMDFVMFDRLLDALSPDARLVLLGDPYQLASVAAGNVLADLIAGLPGAVAPLRVSHRFDGQGGVGALCAAVLAGESAQSLRALAAPGGGFAWDGAPVSGASVAGVLEGYRPLVQAREPLAALEALARFRVLSAFHEGEWGIEGVNALAQALFAGTRAVPVLVEENRHQLELYNGDTGILWRPTGQLWFAQRAQPLDAALAGRVSPCWAMTIHRAQGSEYDAVCVLLGGGPASERARGILTRELLYTGVSRARSRVELLGTPKQVESALARRVTRASGLAARLLRA